MSIENNLMLFQVRGDAPNEACPALFCNFLAVSRVATEVQLEFIFLDLNQIATTLNQLKGAEVASNPVIQGKTVAKVVMPAASFIQLEDQFTTIFKALKEMLEKKEAENELRNNRRVG
ncbi:MAG: hypothetical protein WBD87_08670 [Candidatus Acidiferrales bacterium]